MDALASLHFSQSLLLIILLATISQDHIDGAPLRKISVTLDVSGELPQEIKSISPEGCSNAISYSIKPRYHLYRIIGDVIDGDKVIVEKNLKSISRRVFVIFRSDSVKYVRIFDRRKSRTGGFTRRVDEFMRWSGDYNYTPVARTPVTIDVLTQDNDRFIKMELIQIPDTGDTVRNFNIRQSAELSATIGTVRFGRHFVDGHVDGLMSREVIWEGGIERPIITIISRYMDGEELNVKYNFSDGEFGGFYSFSVKKRVLDFV